MVFTTLTPMKLNIVIFYYILKLKLTAYIQQAIKFNLIVLQILNM